MIRFFDFVFSLIGILILLPLWILLYIIGLFDTGSPILVQERMGKGLVPFKLYKFRTMHLDTKPVASHLACESSVTEFGKFLRKSRIDELPQFINVLKGDMAIIGPRPERPIFVNEIAASIPLYQTRHVIKPGLTGWAQVNYSYGSNLEDSLMKLRYDLYYIKHRSLFLDINIVIKTMSTVLLYKGQ